MVVTNSPLSRNAERSRLAGSLPIDFRCPECSADLGTLCYHADRQHRVKAFHARRKLMANAAARAMGLVYPRRLRTKPSLGTGQLQMGKMLVTDFAQRAIEEHDPQKAVRIVKLWRGDRKVDKR